MTDKTIHIRRWTVRSEDTLHNRELTRDQHSREAMIQMLYSLGFTEDDQKEIEHFLRVDPLLVKPMPGKELVARYKEFGFTVEDGEDLERFLQETRKDSDL